MASKTTRTTTSLNQDQLRSLEKSLTDAYNFTGLNDIKRDIDKQQRKDIIGNIDNPSCSQNNITKIENFKRHLHWKLKDARVEGITSLESFFDAIEKSRENLRLYPNLANLKENLLTKVTVESPAPNLANLKENLSTKVTVESPPRSMSPTRNVSKALPSSSSRSTVPIASERGPISFPGSGSPLKSNIPPPPPNYLAPSYKAQAEEKARREAEAKARREAEAKAQAAKQANQAKDNPSLWHSLTKILLQQNDQKTNQQVRLPEKTDDKKENFLPNWVALVSGLLNQQGEKNESKLPPQKDPPPIDTKREKPIGGQKIVPATNAPSNPIPPGPKTRAPEYYSHSRDICRLQEKFDNNHNISYNSIKNNKTYFDQRVAKWDAELKDIGLKTAPPRRPDEQRLMGFEGYIKYLDSNIKQLQTQELTQEELKNGKNPSVNQYQLKTLIAFHYLEKAKVLYSSGKLHLDGIEGGHFKKESVFNEVPKLYRSYLFDSKFKILQNSYTLPNLEKEPTPEVLQFSSELNIKPPMSARVKNAMSNALDATKEAFEDEASFIKNEMGGRRVLEGVKAVGSGIRSVTSNVVIGALDRAGGAIEWTGVRAKPNTSRVPQNNFIATSSGYLASGSDVRAHDSRLREEKHRASILERDTQPDALARILEKRRDERSKAMHSQVDGKNFHGPYNKNHGGRGRSSR